ncbi:hypothetical protein V8C34DRAFT_270316 [Trichoderma compactum]
MTLVVFLSWFASAAVCLCCRFFFLRRMYEMTFRPRHGIRTRGGLYSQGKKNKEEFVWRRSLGGLSISKREVVFLMGRCIAIPGFQRNTKVLFRFLLTLLSTH